MPKPLPNGLFLKTFKHVPRVAVSLVIRDRRGAVLLARRAIPPKVGSWHMPGSFILKREPINKCIERVAKKELGLAVTSKNAKLLGAFDNLNKDPRGHVIDLVYEIRTSAKPKQTTETKEALFFKKLPRTIGFNHGQTLKKLGYR